MGAGKKTLTFTRQEISLPRWTVNGSVTSRNLGKSKLAGVIFGCKHSTMQECLSEQLFGLPAPHFSYVRNIDPGLPLFLFNYSDRKLHGIFEATSQGSLNIKPYAWTAHGMDYTPYAAQVKIKTRLQCHPLLEDQFRPIISDNYYEPKLFWFELDQRQTNRLIALLSISPILATVSPSKGASNLLKALRTSNVREDSSNSEVFSSNINVAYPDSKKKWSSLFEVSTTVAREDGDDFKEPASEPNISSYEWEPSCTSHSEEESKSCEAPTNGCGRHNEELAFFKSRNEIDSSSYSDAKVEGTEFKSTTLEVNLPHSSHLDGNQDCSFLAQHINATGKVLKDLNLKDGEENMEGDAHSNKDEENLEGNHGEDIQTHWTRTESKSLEANTGVDLNSDCQLVAQLIAEVRELKLLHVEQVQKINLLQHELAGSKSEIESLKSRYERLDCGMNPKKSNMEAKRLQSTKETHTNLDESILIVGGFDGSSRLSTMNCYYPSRDIMESLPDMRSVRSHASAAKLNGEVYVFGGVNGKVWYDTVESYNLANHQWVSRPSLNRKKGSLAGVPLNNKIFAIGGGNGVECFSEVEMFDLDAGRWIQTPSMRHERFALAAGELNGILYAVGGFDGKNYLQSAEMFDPREKSWRGIASMSTQRGCHCLAVLNEKLYALGGYSGDDFIPTVEVFDPRCGSWTITKPMNESRGYSAATVIGDAIYVFGGLKNKEFSERVERYNEDQGWELTNLRAFGKRCFFSAVVL